MQKYNNQRVFPCIFEQKTISKQIELILAHCVSAPCRKTANNLRLFGPLYLGPAPHHKHKLNSLSIKSDDYSTREGNSNSGWI